MKINENSLLQQNQQQYTQMCSLLKKNRSLENLISAKETVMQMIDNEECSNLHKEVHLLTQQLKELQQKNI